MTALYGGQQRVLRLAPLVEPVHLVDEQHRLPAAHGQLIAGLLHRGPAVPLHACHHRGQLHEPAPGDLADHIGERRLAGARRPPQQHRHRRVVVGELAQRRPVPRQVTLADHFIEGARAHPDRQRRGGLLRFRGGVVKQAVCLARIGSGQLGPQYRPVPSERVGRTTSYQDLPPWCRLRHDADMSAEIIPFRVEIPEADLDDLRRPAAPDPVARAGDRGRLVAGHPAGLRARALRLLAARLRLAAVRDRLNGFAQFRTDRRAGHPLPPRALAARERRR